MASMAIKKSEPLVSVHLNFMVTESEAKWLRARAVKATREAGKKVSVSATVRGYVTGKMAEEREARSAARKARKEVSTPAE